MSYYLTSQLKNTDLQAYLGCHGNTGQVRLPRALPLKLGLPDQPNADSKLLPAGQHFLVQYPLHFPWNQKQLRQWTRKGYAA